MALSREEIVARYGTALFNYAQDMYQRSLERAQVALRRAVNRISVYNSGK